MVCGSQRCSPQARCIFTDGDAQPTCQCIAGWRGDGQRCAVAGRWPQGEHTNNASNNTTAMQTTTHQQCKQQHTSNANNNTPAMPTITITTTNTNNNIPVLQATTHYQYKQQHTSNANNTLPIQTTTHQQCKQQHTSNTNNNTLAIQATTH